MADPEPPPTLEYATPTPPERPRPNSAARGYGCIVFGALLLSFGVSSLISGTSDRSLAILFMVLGSMFCGVGFLMRRKTG
jgi:hypothetical protein